jgi:protease-4
VLHRDELVNKVREAGAAADDAGTSFRRVGLHRYAHKVSLPSRGGKIAIVYAEGEIVDGWGGPGAVGGDRLAHDLRSIRGEDEFKAVVLRVNSPGGSAFASDVVAREVALLKKKGCPWWSRWATSPRAAAITSPPRPASSWRTAPP